MDKEPTSNSSVVSEKRHPNLDHPINLLQERSIQEIGFLDIVPNLKDIKKSENNFNDKEKESVRKALKKILIVLPPWRRGADYINQNLVNLAYTSEEQENFARLKAETQKKQVEAEKETLKGNSAWLARVKNNEQNAFNPVIVGFYQMPDKKIRTIFGQRYFQSKRQIEESTLLNFFGGRSEDKEVNLLSTRFQAVEKSKLIKSRLYDLLPEDLRKRFGSGEILVTGEQDLYELSDTEIENLATDTDVNALTKHINNKIADTGRGKQYHLLYQSDYHDDTTGRTGVLMVVENGEVKPLIITVEGNEFVLEIKGCGKKGGGFGEMQYRTGRDIITGGAEREQATNEFNRLSETTDEDCPKPVVSILFDNHGYQQGYILRLTPSTVRASYTSNEVYPAIDRPEQVSVILNIYAQELAQQVFSPNPKILDRSSHSENILLWGEGKHTFTDFSDHVSFSDPNFPHQEDHGGYMTPRQMLKYYVEMVKEIPGYQPKRDKNKFLKALEMAFAQKGHNISLDESEEYDDITKRLWEEGVAYQVFLARRLNNYRADGVVEKFRKSVTNEDTKTDLALVSEQAFIEKYEDGFQKMLAAIETLQTFSGDISKMVGIHELVENRDLSGLLKNLDKLNDVRREQDNLSNNEGDDIRKAIFYFGNLEYTLISGVKRYLDHERDVVTAAKNTAPVSEKMAVVEAENEINNKIQEFETILGDPRDLFRKLTDPSWVQGFLTLSCYQR